MYRNQYGLSQRKINALLSQEGGATLEEFLLEDEHTTNQCRAANAKLMEFMCQKEQLVKLIQYATRVPTNPNNHDQSHK